MIGANFQHEPMYMKRMLRGTSGGFEIEIGSKNVGILLKEWAYFPSEPLSPRKGRTELINENLFLMRKHDECGGPLRESTIFPRSVLKCAWAPAFSRITWLLPSPGPASS